MSKKEVEISKFPFDPGAFNAALFEAYGGDCDCTVCTILKDAVKQTLEPYIKKKK